MTVGDRIRQARELRGMNQVQLAKALGLNQSAIAHIEGGRNDATDEMIKAISFQTGFPVSFFTQGEAPSFSLGTLMFRARVAMTARERQIAYRYAQVAYEVAERLTQGVEEIPVRLPHIEEEPVKAAHVMRLSLGIPDNEPIPKVISPLEKCGVFVLALPLHSHSQDAFSLWAGDGKRPVIALFADKSGDRIRWNVSHELRHLTARANGSLAEIETDANLFAAEFLMPEKAMLSEIVPPVTLSRMMELKAKWGVAIQALVRRAFELEMITERQYRYLFEQIGRHGWRTNEPVSVAVEKPRVLRAMAEAVYGIPLDYKTIATNMRLPYSLTKALFEGHAGTAATAKRGQVLAFKPSVSSSSGRERPS
jgi:Zn-dependent peptidase ImmA (M78 family)/DNA-binding XRE family transcriptional regulator